MDKNSFDGLGFKLGDIIRNRQNKNDLFLQSDRASIRPPQKLSLTPNFSSILGSHHVKRRGPFDDTVLNSNDSFIKKRKLKVDDESDGDLDVTLGTPSDTKHLRSELVQSRAEVKTLESKISQLTGKMKEDLLLYDQERTTLQNLVDRGRKTIIDLEKRIRVLKRREEKLREELSESFENFHQERDVLERKAIEFRDESDELKKKILECEEGKNEAELNIKTLKMEIARLESQLKFMTEQCSLLNEQITSLRTSVKDLDGTKSQLTNANLKIKELESQILSQSETNAVVNAQQAKLLKYSELENKLKVLTKQFLKIKENSSNTIYLETVIDQLNERLLSFESVEKELVHTKVSLGVSESKLDEYKMAAESVLGVGATANRLIDYIRNLQNESLVTANLQAQLKSRLHSLEEAKQSVISANTKLVEEISELKTQLESTSGNFRRLKKQNDLVTWERNDLRRLVDSCQKEMTLGGHSDPRADALEKLVEGYRKKLLMFESENFTSGPPSESAAELVRLRKENDVLKSKANTVVDISEIEKLKNENKELLEKIDKFEYEMEHRALKGDFNTMQTKVLHFKMNPTAVAVEERGCTIEKLRTEIAQLKERIRLIQEGETADLTQNVANIVNEDTTKELIELREKVKTQDIANQRLTEAFKTKGREFREAIYALMGFKVDALKDKLYRLSSLYSETPHQQLLFQMTDEGGMTLLETDFSKSLSELVEMILIPHNSIPVFLASVTIDLFKRQTHTVLENTVQLMQ